MRSSIRFCVVWDQAGLTDAVPTAPPIDFSSTGFYLLEETESAYVAIFVVNPETRFYDDLSELLLNAVEQIGTSTGISLPFSAVLKLMQGLVNGSLSSRSIQH